MPHQLTLDKSVYAVEAIQKAAYRFIDRLVVVIGQDEKHVFCDIEPVPTLQQPYEAVLASFKQELLDQQLRMQIKKETEPVRNLILSLAFSRSGLQG